MNFLLRFLKSGPYVEEIEDQNIIAKSYKYWRYRIFYSMYFGYVFYYFTRKSFTFAMPLIAEDLNLSMAELGALGTTLYLVYGFSKFFSGIFSDQSNPRYFMAIGLILTGIANILFGASSSLPFLLFFWGLNGFFQGWGWPPCTKLLTYWFSKKERGSWWSATSTSHNVGGALIPILVAFLSTHYNWRFALYIPGIISIVCGLWLMNRLRDVPQTLGLPSIESFNSDFSKAQSNTNSSSTSLTSLQILKTIIKNRAVWLLAFSYFFVYVVRAGINDWGTVYLAKSKGLSLISAASCISWFEFGGLFGMLFAGWCSDKIFLGKRAPYLIYSSLCILVLFVVFWMYSPNSLWLNSLFMSVFGFLIFGPQLLVGLAASEFVDKRAACTANGFAGCFAYIGAAFTGYPLGKVIDLWGWDGFFSVMIFSSLLSMLIILPLVFDRFFFSQKVLST